MCVKAIPESDMSKNLKECFILSIHSTVKIEVNQCICVNVHTGILTVCRFAGIKIFARYRYRYDKNTYFLILLQYITQL